MSLRRDAMERGDVLIARRGHRWTNEEIHEPIFVSETAKYQAISAGFATAARETAEAAVAAYPHSTVAAEMLEVSREAERVMMRGALSGKVSQAERALADLKAARDAL